MTTSYNKKKTFSKKKMSGDSPVNRQLAIAVRKGEERNKQLEADVEELRAALETAIDRLKRAKQAYDEKCREVARLEGGHAPLMTRCEEQARRLKQLEEENAKYKSEVERLTGAEEVREDLMRKARVQQMEISKLQVALKRK